MSHYQTLLTGMLLITTSLATYANNDQCQMDGYGGICYFNSLNQRSGASRYFYCESQSPVAFIKMTNHQISISGFISGDGPGAGTLTLAGFDVNRILNHYYFEVQSDGAHFGAKYVVMFAGGHVTCHLGKGSHRRLFPGLLG